MDPKATLQALREDADLIRSLSEDDISDDERNEQLDASVRMAENFQALDEWMDKDGFSPWC